MLLISLALGLASPAAAQDGETPAAEIFGRKIFASDLATANASAPDAESAARLQGEALRTRVWSAVFDDYARRRAIAPSEAEIVSNIENHRRLKAQGEIERELQRGNLMAELSKPDLPAQRRKDAQAQLDVLQRLHAFERERAEELRDPSRQRMQEAAERRVAEHWVRAWKINQALHREFGGRIIFQQAGWEPIDAYRKLIEDYAARDAFVIHDPSLRAAVYRYFEHRFVYVDEAKARFYFEKPYWERTREELRAAGFAK